MRVAWMHIGLLACALAAPTGPRAAAEGAALADVDAFVLAEMRREQVPGVALGVFREGRIVLAKGYGYANIEHRVPVTRETIFQTASVGKQFTAAAVMLQVEDGKLALDDSVTKYFTDAPADWKPITIRHLLTHTSGIADYSFGLGGGGTEPFDSRRDYTEEGLTQAFYGMPLLFEAGTRWQYSNTGYALLGFLIHRVSGRFYGDVLKDRIFTPLGMRTARIISEEDIVANRAAGYRLVNGELKNQEWYSPSVNTTADGSLYLTLMDYFAWDRCLRSRAILSPKSWDEVYSPVILKSGKTYPYGLGWFVDESNGRPLHHHPGDSQGFATYIARYPADDLTIVLLTNLAGAQTARFVDGVAARVKPGLAKLLPAGTVPHADPAIAVRVRALLAAIGAGTLSRRELLYAGRELGDYLQEYAALLHPLGSPLELESIDRRELGDDRASTFRVVYPARVLRVRVVLTPHDEIADIDIRPED
jgi:CubicO group peptidase (beta-lactamase class C family)